MKNILKMKQTYLKCMPKNDAILKNLKIHDRVQESPLLNSIMNQFITVPTLIQY